MHILTVNDNDAGQRLDKFISKAVKAMPMPLMYKSIRTKKIKVNRKRTEPGYMLCRGDTIQLFLRDELFETDAEESVYKLLKPHLSIVYEDENLILCDKPAGMLVHSDDSEDTNTLINHIKAYLYGKGEYDPCKEQSFAPALCNRIDRNTGGIVIAAKNAASLRELNELIKHRNLDKRYLCAVHGVPEKSEGTLTGYITKDGDKNLVTVYTKRPSGRAGENARSIVTGYKVLNRSGDLSLLEVKLITGRTHQIRAHFASVGHPLLGDGKYGVNRDDRRAGYKYQALYSYSLTFHGGNILKYLDGKTFTVPSEKIWFLKEFPDFSY